MASKNPLDIFFNLGNKATGGSAEKKALFDYLLYWILFLAFFGLFVNYMIMFLSDNYNLTYLLWGLVMLVISWFNYWGLKAFRGVYQNTKEFYLNQKKKNNQSSDDDGFDEEWDDDE